MPFNFRPEEREQSLLFPPSIDDYLPEGHQARFVREVILQLHDRGGLAVFLASYREDGVGGKAYNPVTMLAVLIYAYCRGITSSREIARQCYESFPFRYLAANQTPDFRSIAKFRARHVDAFKEVFLQVLKLCREAGLVKLGCVALDGRRVKGNASRDATVTRETLDAELKALTEQLTAAAQSKDAAEDEEHGEASEDDLPPDLRQVEDRKRRVEQAIGQLDLREQKIQEAHEARLREREEIEAKHGRKFTGAQPKAPDPTKTKNRKSPPKANTTDPESRLLKTRGGFVQGYNGQAAADTDTGVIVGALVTQDVVDTRQLGPALDEIEQNLGELPKEVVADAGYWSPENAELEETREVTLYIATRKDSKQRKASKVESAPRGRIPRGANQRQRMERKLLTKKGKAVYRKRGYGIETVFGNQWVRGLHSFAMRGLRRVSGEWQLWCAVANLLKLAKQWEPRAKAVPA